MFKFLLLSLFVAGIIVEGSWFTALPYHSNVDVKYKIVPGFFLQGAAWAKFENKINQTGWTSLTVETNGDFTDQIQAYAAGYLEGQLLMTEIYQNYVNMAPLDPPLDPKAKDFPTKNMEWLKSKIPASPPPNPTLEDSIWTQVDLVLRQSQGIYDGFSAKAPQAWKLTPYQWNALQLNCEVGDINSTAAFHNTREEDLHCSGLVSVTPGNKDIFVSHVTWTSYSWLLRTWKTFKFNFSNSTATKAKLVSYSGYPGVIPSFDDFYITDQKLSILETTNSVFNRDLFKQVTIETIPYWIRVTIATRMADSGKKWNQIFEKYNSGTYNNQWIVVDHKNFVPGADKIAEGVLWVTEQIPGQLYGGDQSHHLNKEKFWASYNVPYYPYVYNISGYPEYVAKHGNGSSYQWCSRAQIFRRDAPKVKTMEDMQKIMRYNNYQFDPFSFGNACNSISARCDLNYPGCDKNITRFGIHGGIDAKISSQSMIDQHKALIVSGPTWDLQLPFAWNDRWSNSSHLGHSKLYAFDWIHVSPDFHSN